MDQNGNWIHGEVYASEFVTDTRCGLFADEPCNNRPSRNALNPMRHATFYSISAAAVLLFFTWFVLGSSLVEASVQDSPPVRIQLARGAPKDIQFTEIPTDVAPLQVAISWDGKMLAYCSQLNDHMAIRLRDLTASTERQLLGPLSAECVNLAFPHDANYLFYVLKLPGAKTANAYRLPLGGGPPALVAHDVGGRLSVAPDGSSITFIRLAPDPKNQKVGVDELIIAAADGLNERIAAISSDEFMVAHADPAWSPDGQQIAVSVVALYPGKRLSGQRCATYSVKTGRVGLIGDDFPEPISSLSWLTSENGLVAVANAAPQPERFIAMKHQIWAVTLPLGGTRQITDDFASFGTITSTSNGDAVLAASTFRFVVRILPFPYTGSGTVGTISPQLPPHFVGNTLSWTSSGEAATNVYPESLESKWQTAAFSLDGNLVYPPATLSSLSCSYRLPVIVGEMVHSNNIQVAVGTAVAEASNQVLLDSLAPCLPDKSRAAVYVVSPFNPGGNRTPSVYSDVGPYGTVAPQNPVYDFWESTLPAALSPDGNYVAAFGVAGKDKPIEILLFDAHSNTIKAHYPVPGDLTSLVFRANLAWTKDGRDIAFLLRKDGNINIWFQPFDPSKLKAPRPPVQVTHFNLGPISAFAFSPDGKQVAVSQYIAPSFVLRVSGLK
jgi:hypothetical protein